MLIINGINAVLETDKQNNRKTDKVGRWTMSDFSLFTSAFSPRGGGTVAPLQLFPAPRSLLDLRSICEAGPSACQTEISALPINPTEPV